MSTARVGGGLVFQLPPSLEGGVDPPSPPLTMTDTVTNTLGLPQGWTRGQKQIFIAKQGPWSPKDGRPSLFPDTGSLNLAPTWPSSPLH